MKNFKSMAFCRWRLLLAFVAAVALAGSLFAIQKESRAEYGDVVINNYSTDAGMRPVVFPHWFHRIRFRCMVCHVELGFEMRAGANDMTMNDIVNGQFCGACHNGEIAWSTEHCDLCHAGLPGLQSGVRGGHQTGGPGRW